MGDWYRRRCVDDRVETVSATRSQIVGDRASIFPQALADVVKPDLIRKSRSGPEAFEKDPTGRLGELGEEGEVFVTILFFFSPSLRFRAEDF